MPKGWLDAHREAGAKIACGHRFLAEFINYRIASIWLQKRIALADDPVVRDHLERSLRWLEKAQAAEIEGLSQRKGGGTLSATRPSRGGRVF